MLLRLILATLCCSFSVIIVLVVVLLLEVSSVANIKERDEDDDEEENEYKKEMRTHFDHENLDVYQLELRFVAWVAELLAKVKQRPSGGRIAEVSDQLDRASLSSLLNTAEDNGRRQRQTRVKFFDDARGSVTECAACLDALVAKGTCTKEEVQEGKDMLLRVASMLTKLISLFDSSSSSSSSSVIREEPPDEEFAREEEDEDENDNSMADSQMRGS